MRHLPKCFDNVHNLTFRKNDAGEPTKIAIGMHSGEGEYVEFAGDCSCDGPVETWLQASTTPDMTPTLHAPHVNDVQLPRTRVTPSSAFDAPWLTRRPLLTSLRPSWTA